MIPFSKYGLISLLLFFKWLCFTSNFIAKQSEFESAASSSDEEAEVNHSYTSSQCPMIKCHPPPQDPVKEAEAEMILDAYEMFNKASTELKLV